MTDHELACRHTELEKTVGPLLRRDIQLDEGETLLDRIAERTAAGDDRSAAKEDFRSFCLEYLKRDLLRAASVYYLYCLKKDFWTEHGRHRVEACFSRLIQKKLPTRSLDYTDYIGLNRKMAELEKELGITTAQGYKDLLKSWEVSFFGGRFKLDSLDLLNTDLKKLDLDIRVYSRQEYGDLTSFILYRTKTPYEEGFEIALEEYARTPSMIHSIVAMGTFIRREAISVICSAKRVEDPDELDIFERPSDKIRRGLAVRIRKLFEESGVTRKDLHEAAVDECMLNIRWWASGNKSKQRFLPERLKNIRDGYKNALQGSPEYLEDNVIEAIDAALEDYTDGDLDRGFFQRVLELSRTDPGKSERMFLSYLDDALYSDYANDSYQKNRTEIIQSLALRFLGENGKVDFVRMEKEREETVRFLVKAAEKIETTLIGFLEGLVFRTENRLVKFRHLSDEAGSPGKDGMKDYDFWKNFFLKVIRNQPADLMKFRELLALEAEIFKKHLLRILPAGENERNFRNLNEYYIHRYQICGIFNHEKNPEGIPDTILTGRRLRGLPF